MNSYFLAGLIKPLFWLLVMLPFLALLRWLLNRYLRPRLKDRTWMQLQAPIGDVRAAVAILMAMVVGGFLVT